MAEAQTFADMVGKIVTYSVIYVPTPEFAGEAPYGLAVIETGDGERLLARLPADDQDKLSVGANVIYDHSDQHGPVFRVR
jgi:uncharacterized OB-fold protein